MNLEGPTKSIYGSILIISNTMDINVLAKNAGIIGVKNAFKWPPKYFKRKYETANAGINLIILEIFNVSPNIFFK